VVWLHPNPPYPVELAPLTKDKVLPLAIELLDASRDTFGLDRFSL
jgi:hypothetical protein